MAKGSAAVAKSSNQPYAQNREEIVALIAAGDYCTAYNTTIFTLTEAIAYATLDAVNGEAVVPVVSTRTLQGLSSNGYVLRIGTESRRKVAIWAMTPRGLEQYYRLCGCGEPLAEDIINDTK